MMRSLTPARVKKIRKALGFSQGDFARTLWVTYTTVNRWEAGRAAPFRHASANTAPAGAKPRPPNLQVHAEGPAVC